MGAMLTALTDSLSEEGPPSIEMTKTLMQVFSNLLANPDAIVTAADTVDVDTTVAGFYLTSLVFSKWQTTQQVDLITGLPIFGIWLG